MTPNLLARDELIGFVRSVLAVRRFGEPSGRSQTTAKDRAVEIVDNFLGRLAAVAKEPAAERDRLVALAHLSKKDKLRLAHLETCDKADPYESRAELVGIITDLRQCLADAEARENGCPREHAGLETAMMKVMGGQKALPDGSLGQDVAALCFGYERMLQREVAEARTAVLQEVNQLACSGLSSNLSLGAMLAMHDRVVVSEASKQIREQEEGYWGQVVEEKVAEARRAQREADCRAVCFWCRDFGPPTEMTRLLVHGYREGIGGYHCLATEIIRCDALVEPAP